MRISDWSSDVCSSDLFVAGNLLGRKDHAIARIELDRVRALGHARQSGARRALPAGRDDHHLLARQAHRLVEIDDLGKVAQITGLARDAQDTVERAAGDAPGPPRLTRDVAQRLRSEEHTTELQSLIRNSYVVFCLKKNKKNKTT